MTNPRNRPMTDAATVSSQELARRIAQGHGDEPADLVLRGGRVFDLVTGAMIEGDVAITPAPACTLSVVE